MNQRFLQRRRDEPDWSPDAGNASMSGDEDRSGPVPDAADNVPEVFGVSVLLWRRSRLSGRWRVPEWGVSAVVAGESVLTGGRRCTLVSAADDAHEYLWSGLHVALHKDGCDSYWNNLLSPQPCLFVVCYGDEAGGPADGPDGMRPVIVTASQDEASAHLESEDRVFRVPMPEKVHQWVERFVVSHHAPAVPRKRSRQAWSGPATSTRSASASCNAPPGGSLPDDSACENEDG
ncbi:MAG: DUF3305 domain-containing protein [Gammaproteobacteria bacterium]|nr:DUF3305 domain-containing protein [Gammaproteobacteria bacterium]